MKHILVLLVLSFGAPAHADLSIFLCSVGTKELSVNADANYVSYAFGPPSAPELELVNPLERNGFTPWPGIGRAIFESVAFENEGFSYVVHWSLDRLMPGGVMEGGVTISGGGDVETTLLCDPGSVQAPFFTLSDHLSGAGLCLDLEARSWGTCSN